MPPSRQREQSRNHGIERRRKRSWPINKRCGTVNTPPPEGATYAILYLPSPCFYCEKRKERNRPTPDHYRPVAMVYEYISSYNLTLGNLEAYLRRVFPGSYITVNLATQDRYVAELPSALTSTHLAEINRLRRSAR